MEVARCCGIRSPVMQPSTPFDAALAELLRSWKVRDDLHRHGQPSLPETTAAWLALDRARSWVGSFDAAGRQPGWLSATSQTVDSP